MISYWASIVVIDMFKLALPMLSFIVMCAFWDINALYSSILVIQGCIGTLLLTYCISFLFDDEIKARTWIRHLALIFSGMSALAVYGLCKVPYLSGLGLILSGIFRVSPAFSMSYGVLNMLFLDPSSPSLFYAVLPDIITEIFMISVFCLLLSKIENGSFNGKIMKEFRTESDNEIEEDSDITEEYQNVKENGA